MKDEQGADVGIYIILARPALNENKCGEPLISLFFSQVTVPTKSYCAVAIVTRSVRGRRSPTVKGAARLYERLMRLGDVVSMQRSRPNVLEREGCFLCARKCRERPRMARIRTTAAAATVWVVLGGFQVSAQPAPPTQPGISRSHNGANDAHYGAQAGSWQNVIRPPRPIGSDTDVSGSVDPKLRVETLPAEVRPESGQAKDLAPHFRRQLLTRHVTN